MKAPWTAEVFLRGDEKAPSGRGRLQASLHILYDPLRPLGALSSSLSGPTHGADLHGVLRVIVCAGCVSCMATPTPTPDGTSRRSV